MCGWLRALGVTLPCPIPRDQLPSFGVHGSVQGQTHSTEIWSLEACRQTPSEEGPFPGLRSAPLEPVQPISEEEFSPATGTCPPIPTSPQSPGSQSLLHKEPQPHSKADVWWLPVLREPPDSPLGTGTGLHWAPGSRMTLLFSIPALAMSWGQVWGGLLKSTPPQQPVKAPGQQHPTLAQISYLHLGSSAPSVHSPPPCHSPSDQ